MPSQLLAPAAEPDVQAAPGRECRVYERHACGLASQCQPASSIGKEDLKWPATLENISQSGVCLNLRRRFEPGTGLTIELPGAHTQDAYVVLAKVVHVRRQESGFWFLGCQFISELSEDEMHRLLHHQERASEPPPIQEVAAAAEDVTPSLPPAEKPKERCRVSQVRLLLEIAPRTSFACIIPHFAAARGWPLLPGAVGMLKGNDMAGEPWKLKVKVVQCLSRGEGWNLECRLVKAPARSDLLRSLGALIAKNVTDTPA